MTDKVKVALCIYGTLRAPKNCFPTLYENIVKPWDADVIICANKQYQDDEERVNILRSCGAKIVEQNIETQPDLNTWFPKSFYEKLIPLAQNKLKGNHINNVNYLSPLVGSHSSLHTRVNWYRLSFILQKHIEKHDYFIITRPDHLYLFPLFDKCFLEENKIIHYGEHSWGGINFDFVIIHRNMVMDWLKKSIEYLIEDRLQDVLISELSEMEFWNSERYSLLISNLCGWKTKEMAINSFISADSLDELTSNNKIKYDGKYYFKYETSYQPCLKNFELWKNGWKWRNAESKIELNEP